MGGQAMNAKRTNLFHPKPEDLVVIGVDTKDGPEHPLWDERAFLPLDEGMVISIMRRGVKEPVLVRKNGKHANGENLFEVEDGRRRVLHAREANRRIKKEGESELLVLVPSVIDEDDSDESAQSTSIMLNEIRRQDDLLVKCAKLQRMLARNPDEKSAAIAFGVSVTTIRSWKKVDGLAAPVKKAVAAGQISVSAAADLHDFNKKEQVEKLDKLLQAVQDAPAVSNGKTKKTTRREVQKANGERVAPGKKTIKKLLLQFGDKLDDNFKYGMQFVLGEIDPDEALQKMLDQLDAPESEAGQPEADEE